MQCSIRHDKLPHSALELINKLNHAGFEAWFVGGCVRDLLMGRVPHDWDICTNALPEETKECLSEFRIHDVGIKHGTVLVMAENEGYEITTYRVEKKYSDHRHPDSVEFVRDLTKDLARRDFTINAMAYHSQYGLVDEFGGKQDLEQGVIRCVGDPVDRFMEDALRILRALRFASRFGFQIEAQTAEAIHGCKKYLSFIAQERIYSELKEILCNPGIKNILVDFYDVFGVFLPEILPCVGYDQNTPHHDSDIWGHTARVVEGVSGDNVVLRLAALFHDIAKPDCCEVHDDGYCHFWGHNYLGAEKTEVILRRLRSDKATIELVTRLVSMHDAILPQDMAATRRFLGKHSVEDAKLLIELKRADVMGQSTFKREMKLGQIAAFEALIRQAEQESPCWDVSQLAINGKDLIESGVLSGPEIGRILKLALQAVVNEQVTNEKEALLNYLYRQGEIKR